MKRYKRLSNSEQAIFDCYLDGMSQEEIAKYLNKSLSTIKHHTKSLHTKHTVTSTLALIVKHYKTLLNRDFPC